MCIGVRERGGGENEAQSKSYVSNDMYVRVKERRKKDGATGTKSKRC